MNSWIMSVVGTICLTVIIDIIMEEGETKKFVKGITSLIVFAVIISPLPKLINGEFNLTNQSVEETNQSVSVENHNFLLTVKQKQMEAISEQCEISLSEAGIEGVEIIPVLSFSDKVNLNEVTVDISNAVISSDALNININELIVNEVSNRFGIKKS